jgi:polar amino acid transport system substrate-binding protein
MGCALREAGSSRVAHLAAPCLWLSACSRRHAPITGHHNALKMMHILHFSRIYARCGNLGRVAAASMVCAGTVLTCIFLPGLCAAQQMVDLMYNDRPPYIIAQADGSAAGLTATPAIDAFRRAGIPVEWKRVPTNRQLTIIGQGSGNDCAIGWFKNAERERFAKFTKPIYRDKPTVLLANRWFAPPPDASLRDLLARPDVRVLVKDRFSYGPYIDGLLAEMKPLLIRTTNENRQMVAMIKANRADFMFVSEDEADYLVEQAGFNSDDFRLLHPDDMPAGEKRYLICSKHVDDSIIARLNAAIAEE